MKLTKIAARIGDQVYSGASEEEVLKEVLQTLEDVGLDKLEMGFLGKDEKFYSKKDALSHAKGGGQIKDGLDLSKSEWLSPLDLKDFPAN